MLELIKESKEINEGDILFLEKVNKHQTNHPYIKNVVLVKEIDEIYGEKRLVVEDYNGYLKKMNQKVFWTYKHYLKNGIK